MTFVPLTRFHAFVERTTRSASRRRFVTTTPPLSLVMRTHARTVVGAATCTAKRVVHVPPLVTLASAVVTVCWGALVKLARLNTRSAFVPA